MSSTTLLAETPDNACCEMKIASAADAPARLTITIRNLGAPLVGVSRSGTYNDLGISVKADTGGEVGLTEMGRRLFGQKNGGSRTYEQLWTGESLKEERSKRAGSDCGRVPHFDTRPLKRLEAAN
jgi:hypothetical protein